ncbi:MAG: prepilin-type N-terminal cleavage/methylation domain-containing protein [Verrucomicrobiota bacterium]
MPAAPALRRRSPAFTLLEMVISLGLLALLASLAIMAAAAITNSWSRLESRQQQFAELMRVDRTLDSMLSNIVGFSWRNADGNTLPFFRGQTDTIRFAYRHRLNNAEEGALRFVRLDLADGQLRALYHPRPVLNEDGLLERGRTSILADGVEQIEFQYAVIRAEMTRDDPPEWTDQWDPEDWSLQERQKQRSPLAVRIQVRWRDGRVENWLRRLPGNGLHGRRGQWQPLNPDA